MDIIAWTLSAYKRVAGNSYYCTRISVIYYANIIRSAFIRGCSLFINRLNFHSILAAYLVTKKDRHLDHSGLGCLSSRIGL